MNSLFQLNIPRRQTHCTHQGEPLLPGVTIYSLLLEEENSERMLRRDFCVACWTVVQSTQAGLPAARGYWKSRIEERKMVEGSSRIARALSLLQRLWQENSETQAAEIFVLSLFLSHARRLALRREFQKEGETYHLYEILRQDQFLTVKVVNLSPLEIESLQKSLAIQLHAT